MTGEDRHGLGTSEGPLDPMLERIAVRCAEILASQVDAMVRRHIDRVRAQAIEASWLTQPEAAALAGVRPQTIRSWQRSGKLSKGARARVRRSELEELLATGGAPAPAGPVDLRARRAAREILAGKRGSHVE